MKESTATIGDGHHHHDRTGSECFPCRWPEIKNNNYTANTRLICFYKKPGLNHSLKTICLGYLSLICSKTVKKLLALKCLKF